MEEWRERKLSMHSVWTATQGTRQDEGWEVDLWGKMENVHHRLTDIYAFVTPPPSLLSPV